jgi:multiple sugar transport system permease protein
MKKQKRMSYSQNSVSFGNGFGKSGQKSAFPSKSKVAFPKTGVLGKPRMYQFTFPVLFLLPSLLLVSVINIYPFLTGVMYSFRDGNLLRPGTFVGFQNYLDLFHLGDFWQAVIFSATFAGICVSGGYLFGLFIALILNMDVPFRGFFRAALLIPWIVPSIVSVVCWRWLVMDQLSLANVVLGWFGIEPIYFLVDKVWVVIIVCLVKIWKNFPFIAVSLLAAMQSINKDLYEAAKIDGANRFQAFFKITMPFLLPISKVCGILLTIWSFNDYDILRMLTDGGPMGRTTNIILLSFNYAFSRELLGTSSAMAVIALIIVLIFSNFLLRRKNEITA